MKSAPRRKGAKKAAKPKAARPGERESVMEAVSQATGVTFEVVSPHPGFPLSAEKLEWFMRCRNKEEIPRAPFLNVAWKERGDGIWMESLAVGDTVDWIVLAYGEEEVNKSLDLDYSRFDDAAFQELFNRRFPIVFGRIEEYQKAVGLVARRKKLKLELRHAGSRGILVFTVAAKLDVRKGAGAASLKAAVEKTVAGLKDAYEAVSNL